MRGARSFVLSGTRVLCQDERFKGCSNLKRPYVLQRPRSRRVGESHSEATVTAHQPKSQADTQRPIATASTLAWVANIHAQLEGLALPDKVGSLYACSYRPCGMLDFGYTLVRGHRQRRCRVCVASSGRIAAPILSACYHSCRSGVDPLLWTLHEHRPS